MQTRCDLHTHSVFSDGTYTPSQLIQEAERLGLAAIALTDHNTVDGLPDFLEAAKESPVEAVPGIEFSSEWRGHELHILALWIRPEHYTAVRQKLEEYNQRKHQSNLDLIRRLRCAGMDIDYEDVRKDSGGGHVNRANIAAVLLERGYVSSVKEAFNRYLYPEQGFYIPPQRLDSFEIIRFIKSLGAAAVLAHPLLSLEEAQLRQFLTEEQGCGLDAMETVYSTYDEETTRTAHRIAAEFGLKCSGGSDFHGANKPDISMGRGRGNLVIPGSFLQNLQL